jgi:two-component system chemotaxis response regulator CheY
VKLVVDFSTCWWIVTTSALVASRQDVTLLENLSHCRMSMMARALRFTWNKNVRADHDATTSIYQPTKEGAMDEFKSGFFVGGEACEGRVLVVDDEPDIRKVVKMTLQKAGYEVLEAENGEKAIDVINSGENRLLLDVVICDIRMPKINGAEAVAYFRSNFPRVPLIVLTGFPDTDMATSFLRQGVVDYLVKPVEGEKLKSAVARAIEQRELARL